MTLTMKLTQTFKTALLLLLSFCCSVAYAQNKSEIDINNFRDYIIKVKNEWKIPGIAAGVIKDGKVVLNEGFGIAHPDGTPVNETSLFQIGSVSKSFTATLMARLVDEGKVKWEDTVKSILPDLDLYDNWIEENLQVKDIMTHRMGMKGQQGTYIPNLGYSRDDVYRMMHLLKPGYSFRGSYEYNNITFIIAQRIIEKLSGKSWEDNLKDVIFEPVGMYNSSANGEPFAASPYAAVPYDYGWRDSIFTAPIFGEEQALHWLTVVGPAGSVNSTVPDMLKYVQFHLDKGKVGDKEIISKKGMDFLHKGQTITSQDSARTTLYAHCWFVEQNSKYRLWFHTGTTWGFTTLVGFVPELNLGMVFLVNSDAPANLRYSLMRRLIDMYRGEEVLKDYSADYLAQWIKSSSESREKAMKREASAERSAAPPVESLVGVYDKGELFGKAVVDVERGEAYITIGPKGWRHKLVHRDGNEFTFRSDGHAFRVKFDLGENPCMDLDFGGNENFGPWMRVINKK